MLYKIVSFLVWFHLQGKLPIDKAPNMKDVVPNRVARRHWYVHIATLPALLASALWPVLSYAAGAPLLLSAGMLLANLYRANGIYQRTMAIVAQQSSEAPPP